MFELQQEGEACCGDRPAQGRMRVVIARGWHVRGCSTPKWAFCAGESSKGIQLAAGWTVPRGWFLGLKEAAALVGLPPRRLRTTP